MSYLDETALTPASTWSWRARCAPASAGTAQFISIKAENAYVELSSGNVDVRWGGLTLDPDDDDVRCHVRT